MYHKLYKEFATPDYKITEEYDDDLMSRAILLHEGDSMPGFPSADVFVSLIQPQIERLKMPALDLLQDVYNYLEELASSIQMQTFMRFPTFGDEILEKIVEIMQEEREKTRYLVESVIDSEQTYMFTNDPEYLINRTEIVPVSDPKAKIYIGGKAGVEERREEGGGQVRGPRTAGGPGSCCTCTRIRVRCCAEGQTCQGSQQVQEVV